MAGLNLGVDSILGGNNLAGITSLLLQPADNVGALSAT